MGHAGSGLGSAWRRNTQPLEGYLHPALATFIGRVPNEPLAVYRLGLVFLLEQNYLINIENVPMTTKEKRRITGSMMAEIIEKLPMRSIISRKSRRNGPYLWKVIRPS